MGQKAKKTSSVKDRARSAKIIKKKPATAKGGAGRKALLSKKKVAATGTAKKNAPKSGKGLRKKAVVPEAKPKKSPSATKANTAAPDSPPPGLLRKTKSSEAALKHLEKAIELIYRKDFRKARSELKTLLHSFSQETEILARARSYILICDREESAQRKTETTAEQLYALGVMEHNNANYDQAVDYYLQSMKSNPDLDYIYYSMAASQAMKGDLGESLKNLRKAIELNRDSRIYARNDHDFDVLQENREFAELMGISSDPDSEIP